MRKGVLCNCSAVVHCRAGTVQYMSVTASALCRLRLPDECWIEIKLCFYCLCGCFLSSCQNGLLTQLKKVSIVQLSRNQFTVVPPGPPSQFEEVQVGTVTPSINWFADMHPRRKC